MSTLLTQAAGKYAYGEVLGVAGSVSSNFAVPLLH